MGERKRYRVVVEMDAEWRENDPGYAPGCIEVDLLTQLGGRTKVLRVLECESVLDRLLDALTDPVLDARLHAEAAESEVGGTG